MMNLSIKGISIENFKGIGRAEYNFSTLTEIFGANATGKTTIVDAFWWLLFNKDSQGNEKFKVRPIDESGKDIDNVEISVSAAMEVDGKRRELKKVQKQKWVKKRGNFEAVFQGNENSYEVDGYPKPEKDYKEFVSGIASEEIFKILTNPTYFPSMKWQDQRKMIMELATDASDAELALKDKRFSELMDDLENAPSTEDIKKKYQKALSEWKKKQGELPVRIDEIEKQKVDIDVAELELQRNALKEKITENKAKQEDISKQFAEYDKMTDGIMELQFELSDLQRKANEENNHKRREIEDKISDKKFLLSKTERTIRETESDISDKKEQIAKNEERIGKMRKQYTDAQGRVFDENNLVCHACGREYPEEEKEEIRADFEHLRQQEMLKVAEVGNTLKETINKEKEELQALENELSEHKKSLEMLNTAISDLEQQLSTLPQSIDISEREDVKALKQQIAEKEQAMSKGNSADEIRQQLKDECEGFQTQLNEVEKQIALAERNIEIDERISDLRSEQRNVSQKAADQEKMLYLLEEFIRFKMDSISSEINRKFDGIGLKLFDNQINGGVKECCELTYGGVPYGSLNSGHRIVAGLKIITALQKHHGIYAPIFVDNAESINDFNIPETDCQMVLLKVSNDEELRIEVRE